MLRACPMPLDRSLVITYTGAGHRNEHGEYVDGRVIRFVVWAELRDSSLGDNPTQAGQLQRGTKTYRTRYLPDLELAPTSALTVNDGSLDAASNPIEYSVDDFREMVPRGAPMRRRFHDFTILFEN